MSTRTLTRLPLYLGYLKKRRPSKQTYISAKAIADGLGLNEVQVRKDLAAVSDGGHPRVGYDHNALIRDIDKVFSGFSEASAALVGAGNLGKALLSMEYGLNISAVFDVDEKNIGTTIGGKNVLSVDLIEEVCRQEDIRIGIIAVPGFLARYVCDRLVDGGIQAILNYSPTCLQATGDVLVQNENISVSFAVLSKLLMERCFEAQQK